MATPDQIRLVRTAQRACGMTDQAYRVVLHNVAGVTSTKGLDNSTFEDVMSILESSGFADRVHGCWYWSRKVAARGTYANERMVYKVRQLAAQVDRYPLAAMCLKQSGGRTDDAGKLYPREAWRLIEALKAIGAREDARPAVPAAADDLTDDDVPF